jgi:hypothetical protein
VTFDSSGTASVLASTLTANIKPIGTAGWAGLSLTGNGHDMLPATNGNIFHGLPITGFQATDFVKSDVGGVVAYYGGVNRHRISRSCSNGAGVCS